MRGIVRPCRSCLGPELHARWQAHLCGLCLTLRDVAGQAERCLTGYDVLLLSVLVEAQAGAVETTTASPCPLRGFTRATVVASTSDAARLAAAGALLTGGTTLTDKADDGDLVRPVRSPARKVAARLTRAGTALADAVGLDARPVLRAPAAAAATEHQPWLPLRSLLRPTGDAVAELFSQTAVTAGTPSNRDALWAAGQAFGQLVHLLDAVEDRHADRSAGRFNPLESTGTDDQDARVLADTLVAEVTTALAGADLADRALVDVLLGPELERAVRRVLPTAAATGHACAAGAVPQQRHHGAGAAAASLAAWGLAAPAVIIGGSWGGGGRRRRRHRRSRYAPGYGYGPGYGHQGYGYRRVGPSCGQCLACNCCANLACNACCCECMD